MEKLSIEIHLNILKYCTFQAIIQLRQVCWLYKRLVEEELQKTESLDVTEDYIQIYDALSNTLYLDDVQMRPKKLIHFLANYMPRVRKLSLRSTPFIFQLSDLIQIAKAAPLIEWLDITQVNNKPSFDKDSSMALSYFNNLKTLKMNGFTKLFIKPSRPYELEIPSEKLLHSLEQIEILEERYNECSKEPVVGMLFSLYTTSTVLGRLRHVNFGVCQCHRLLPELLIWFLHWHKRLQTIRLHNILFKTNKQFLHFYRALMLLPELKTVELDSCTQITSDTEQLELQLMKSLNNKGVLLTVNKCSQHSLSY